MLLLLVLKNDGKMRQQAAWVRTCGKLIRSTTNLLDVQRTADASGEMWEKYSA